MDPIIQSMLDDDAYKLTMCQAICQLYPEAAAEYTFINRGDQKFPAHFTDHLWEQILNLTDLRISKDELAFLRASPIPFNPVFLEWLAGYHYDPREVDLSTQDGRLNIRIVGPWYRTIMWEVKLMAIISELYFNYLDNGAEYDESLSRSKAAEKANIYYTAHLKVADFGTRRRFSYKNHDMVLGVMRDSLIGTSNMHFAMKHSLPIIGTQAHEWFMYHGAIYGYQHVNEIALDQWARVYKGKLGIALTDTYTSSRFLDSFGPDLSRLYDGLRHDSGSPHGLVDKVVDHYKRLDIDPLSKIIVFSDSLDTSIAREIKAYCHNKIRCSFGIGTNITNDCGVKPLNMVIKMSACAERPGDTWHSAVKLSDVPTKNTGNPEEVARCKAALSIS